MDPAVLELTRKRIREERVLATAIDKDLVKRWKDIIQQGLPNDETEIILKKYPLPKNSTLIDPSTLNEEVQAVMQEAIVKRVERIMKKLEKITAAITQPEEQFEKSCRRKIELRCIPF